MGVLLFWTSGHQTSRLRSESCSSSLTVLLISQQSSEGNIRTGEASLATLFCCIDQKGVINGEEFGKLVFIKGLMRQDAPEKLINSQGKNISSERFQQGIR